MTRFLAVCLALCVLASLFAAFFVATLVKGTAATWQSVGMLVCLAGMVACLWIAAIVR